MGQFLVNFPDLSDADLVFDEGETKQILIFFYPDRRDRIMSMTVTNDARRLAQTMLIAAIDSTASMSYIEAVVRSFSFSPGKPARQWAKKLVKGLVKQWFKNAKQKDLLKAEVYEPVRVSIAWACARYIDAVFSNVVERITLPKKQICTISTVNGVNLGRA